MLAYPYIESVFKAVLKHSKVMRGRFHICPQFAFELNTNNLEQVLKFAFGEDQYKAKKYPLTIMLPPASTGDYASESFTDDYDITLYFLCTSFYTGSNQVKGINKNTNKSQHTVIEDWHDMKRCAVAFVRALRSVVGSQLFIKEGIATTIDPVSLSGPDRVSGVKLMFSIRMSEGCEVEDYPANFEELFQMPEAVDTHPEHLH